MTTRFGIADPAIPLGAETAVVWLTDPLPPFVYETTVLAGRPDGPLRRTAGRLIAYTELDLNPFRPANRHWPRRTWWVPTDPAHRPGHDAVDPASVRQPEDANANAF